MNTKRTAAIILVLMVFGTPLMATPVHTELPKFTRYVSCTGFVGPPGSFGHLLAEVYERRLSGGGMDLEGNDLIQLWVGPDDAWTLTIVDENGMLCILAHGSQWMFKPQRGEPT